MFIIEPGDNPIEIENQLEKEPQPPEGFIDSTVKRGRLLPDGSIEWYGTQDPYPEGWDDPQRFQIKLPGSGKKKIGEVKNMQSRPDKEEIMAKARPMLEAGMSISKTARELGVPLGTLDTWIKKERIAKQKAESEEEITVAKDEKPDNFDEEFDAALAKQQEQAEPAKEDDIKIFTSQRQNHTITQHKEQIKQGDFIPADDEPIPYVLPLNADITNDINWVKIEIIKTAIEEAEARDLPGEVILDLVGQIKDLEVGA